jgi:ABC-type ATPase involved in cell division
MIFQDIKLLPKRTAYENIAFAMEAVGKTDEEIASDVPHVLELVDLSHRLNHFPDQMSGGEQQRLAIARAIINQPELIIADDTVAVIVEALEDGVEHALFTAKAEPLAHRSEEFHRVDFIAHVLFKDFHKIDH